MKLFLIFILISLSSASRILFLIPTLSKSHMVKVHALSTTLAEQGHDVTVVSPFPLKEKLKNHREIPTLITQEEAKEMINEIVEKSKGNSLKMVQQASSVFIKVAIDTVRSEEFKKLLSENFDLLVLNVPFNNFLLGLGDHFKCPTVIFSVHKHMAFTNLFSGNPIEQHAVPHLTLEPMESTFMWRVKNFLVIGAEFLISIYLERQQKLAYK